MRALSPFLCIAACVAASRVPAPALPHWQLEGTPCGLTVPGLNVTFDLTPLQDLGTLTVDDALSAQLQYYLAVCSNAQAPAACASLPASPAFQTSVSTPGYYNCYSLGSDVEAQPWRIALLSPSDPTAGVSLQYTNGSQSWCPYTHGHGAGRSLTLELPCAATPPGLYANGSAALVAQSNTCDYSLRLPSTAGCPVSCLGPPGGEGGRSLCSGAGVCALDAASGGAVCLCNEGSCGPLCQYSTNASAMGRAAAAGAAALQAAGGSSSAGSTSRDICGDPIRLMGMTFDLSELTRPPGMYYRIVDGSNNQGSSGNFSYLFNVCGLTAPADFPQAQAAACAASASPPSGTAYRLAAYPGAGEACAQLGDDGMALAAPLDATALGSGLVLTYSSAASPSCRQAGGTRFSLRIACGAGAAGGDIPDSAPISSNGCATEVALTHPAGCPLQCPFGADASTGRSALCSGRGKCAYDGALGSARCFCLPGAGGADCSGSPAPTPCPFPAASLSPSAAPAAGGGGGGGGGAASASGVSPTAVAAGGTAALLATFVLGVGCGVLYSRYKLGSQKAPAGGGGSLNDDRQQPLLAA